MRVGIGYDVHRFSDDPGRSLMLGGVHFPDSRGLEGHSDADVVLHAIIDAVLGAAALGDIGDHFPPDDQRWKDADSRELMREVVSLISNDYRLLNVDVSIIAEQPRISTMRDVMRDEIANALALDRGRVSVKATTNERLGAIGRGEGIAAHAVALLEEV